MKKFLVEMLECPDCHHHLEWRIVTEIEDEIEQAEAHCSSCEAMYPVMDGIGLFLTPDLPRNDLWEDVDSHLAAYLKSHPEHEKRLMGTPAEELSATDQQFRALVLDERGEFGAAIKVEELAHRNMYTVEYKRCWDSQIEFTLATLESFSDPIIDLASGRGYLVEKIARRLGRQVVATDFSPNVLRRNRQYFKFLELDHLISLLAFDARKTPFKSGAIEIMTTNQGLTNIEQPGNLTGEIKRIVRGTFMGISHFFPEDDDLNRAVIEEAGIDAFVYEEPALRYFSTAGFKVRIENACLGKALPTPESDIFAGARADGLPVGPTNLTWGTIRAENV